MKTLKFFILFTVFLLADTSSACAQERGFFRRHYNNMIAHYNIYFNATQKFEKATTSLYESHEDDFEKFIEVYPYGTLEDAKNMREPMDAVMKKASKVIQNKPLSKWADDAYFLIGQTHFFANDQFSAIETFQYVYSKYKDPKMKAKAQLWVMKSYVRQEKYADAEAILGLIRQEEYKNKRYRADVHLVAGDLYVKQQKYDLAITELSQGVELTKDRQLRYRAHFLLGQLCLETERYQESSKHFLKVIKLTTPYTFDFNANMGLTKVTARSGGKGIKATKKNLKRMLKDDKNIEYFDQIYYELALLEFVEGNEQQGLDYLIQSSNNAGANAKQKTKTYLFLADYFFENKDYDRSQRYYDSAVSVLPLEYPDHDIITTKHAVLSTLIEGIKNIQLQDSLLALAELPKEQLDRKIDDIVEEQRRLERIAKDEEEAQRQRDRLDPGGLAGGGGATPSGGSTWYFYDAAQVGRGTNDFERNWGKRKYGDWWRFTNKIVAEESTEIADNTEDESEDPLDYNPEEDQEQQDALAGIEEDKLKYYEDIPFSEMAKLVARKKIEDELIKVAKIYFDDLKEYDMSMVYLLRLLNSYPKGKHEAECIFYLAKTERNMEDTAAYDAYALRIANEYPNTAYNAILNNAVIAEAGTEQEVLELYDLMYETYKRGQFDSVVMIKKLVATEHAGNAIQAKFDYVYALTMGKTKGQEAYVAELRAIVDNYPGTEIASLAKYTINYLMHEGIGAGVDLSMYSTAFDQGHYYVVTGKCKDFEAVQNAWAQYNNKFYPSQTFLIKSIEQGDRIIFYLKPFSDKTTVTTYHVEIFSNLSFLQAQGLEDIRSYGISESNFKVLVKQANEEDYILFFRKHYPTEL